VSKAAKATQIETASAVLGAALLAIALLAPSAPAKTVPIYTYSDYVDGSGSTAGTFEGLADVAVHQGDGKVYTVDRLRLLGSVSLFDAAGIPVGFPALGGATSVSLKDKEIDYVAVDSTGGPADGNIYVVNNSIGRIRGFAPDGTELPAPFPAKAFDRTFGLAVDPQGDLWVTENGKTGRLLEFNSLGIPTGQGFNIAFGGGKVAIDSVGNFYVAHEFAPVKKYDPKGKYLYDVTTTPSTGVAVDPSNDNVFIVERTSPFSTVTVYDSSGARLSSFGGEELGNSYPGFEGSGGIAVNQETHDVYVTSSRNFGGTRRVEVFSPTDSVLVPTVTTDAPELTPSSAILKGSVDLDGGGDVTQCYFEWGTTFDYGNTLPCNPPAPISGEGVHQVSASLPGLTQGTSYHYRLAAANANGVLSQGGSKSFKPQGPAVVSKTAATEINTDGVTFTATIDPGGGNTSYRFEYGLVDCELGPCSSAPLPDKDLGDPLAIQQVSEVVTGLEPNTSYHYRVVATNEFGATEGPDLVFSTYPNTSAVDACPNARVRKQTGAGLLPECRAYELVSAANAGGFDVRSDLLSGLAPLQAHPRAQDQVLYSLTSGAIPGVSGDPTNRGSDPYLAQRGANGWSTRYVGLSASATPSLLPFGSPLAQADLALSTFVFGGADLCDPCFADGKVGIPVRLASGEVVQGMAGSLDPGPSLTEDGYLAKQLSDDGAHLIFGSASQLEPDANSNGDVSIYKRDLQAESTQVISKAPDGGPLPCLQGAGTCHGPGNPDGIAALDVSTDGSRTIVAQKISTDAKGNRYWHPYMHVGNATTTIDLAPGTTSGVLYAGMSADGTEVYFTSPDQLTSDDHDTSVDLFRADVGPTSAALTRVSAGSGATGDTDACDPSPNSAGNHWNAVGESSTASCSVTTVAGGGGVASEAGSIFFLSPEQLEGSKGMPNQPNLYLAVPGSAPRFVATLEVENPIVTRGLADTEVRNSSDMQISPDGEFAVFSSSMSLTGFPTYEHTAIYRYAASSGDLDCASCSPNGAPAAFDTTLSPYGLNLTDDGRVFYATDQSLALRDTAETSDVYEWSEGDVDLITTGTYPIDSGLLSVSADGVDAYFFTRETLTPADKNGATMKIYDAREGGGFIVEPPPVPCQASDECHGPSTQSAPPPAIGTFKGEGGNARVQTPKRCGKTFVKKRGRCLKRRNQRRRQSRRRNG
jgi:hypothetical protein